jgi:thiamine pyrophosphokinase
VRKYYAARGVEVSKDPDQYSTDFGKSMQKIASIPSSFPAPREIVILSTLGGRVDQGLGLLHEMIREELRDSTLRLWLVSESSISFVLKKGCNVIEGLKSSGTFTQNMGLLPIYGPATITTSGLEWDVQDWDTQMGTQVSTSNHVTADEVRVQTTASILFTIERSPIPAETGTET